MVVALGVLERLEPREVRRELELLDAAPIAPRRASAGVLLRILMSPMLRRVVPAAIGVRLAAAAARIVWRFDGRYRARLVAALASADEPSAELDRLAHVGLVERFVWLELACRPWLTDRVEVEDLRNLKDAITAGRGTLLSTRSLGPVAPTAGVVARFCRPYIVACEPLAGPSRRGLEGCVADRYRDSYRRHDGRIIDADHCFAVVAGLLERGAVVTVPFELRIGRSSTLAHETARLAMSSGALVVPVVVSRRGYRLRVGLCTPLDPAAFHSVHALEDALAAAHPKREHALSAEGDEVASGDGASASPQALGA